MKRDWILTLFAGATLGFIVGFGLANTVEPDLPPELELKAYRHCMQDIRCYMDPPAYVRYYELKYKLEDQ